MKTLFDSSAFAKRYVEEVGSREVDALCVATSALALSVVCVPEIISALNRRLREKRLSVPPAPTPIGRVSRYSELNKTSRRPENAPRGNAQRASNLLPERSP